MILRVLISAAFIVGATAGQSGDALGIVSKSVQHDQVNWQRARDYTFNERVVERKGDGNGHYIEKDVETFETVVVYGRPFQRLIAKNDKPLSEKDRRKEQERFDKEVEKRRQETEDGGKADSEYDKNREQRRKIVKEITSAYTFRLLGEEQVDGQDAYVISAEPRPDFQPRTKEGNWLRGLHGKIWIAKRELQWVKVEADVVKPLKWGFFIATLAPGSTLYFEQRRVNNELWLPRKVVARVNGRFTFKHYDMEVESEYRDYRKFHTDSRITAVGEEPAQ